MALRRLPELLKLTSLLCVGALLIGHGTPTKTNTFKISWHELKDAQLEFDLSASKPERRFLVEIVSNNYKPKYSHVPIWMESFYIQGTRGTIDPAVSFRLTDKAGNERFGRRVYYNQHVGTSGLIKVMISPLRPPAKNKYLPIVASCSGKTCKTTSILTIRRDSSAPPGIQHITLRYTADLMGPSYCSSCKLGIRPRKPLGARISVRLVELK